MAECFSRFTLLRYALKEFPAEQLQRMEGHISGCEQCKSVLADAEADFGAYREGWDDHVGRLRRKMGAVDAEEDAETEAVGWPGWRWVRMGLTGAVALAAAAVVATVFVRPPEDPGRHDVAFKGELALEIIAKRGDVQLEVTNGTLLRAGDALRFVLTTGRAGYVTVFSLDGRGAISPYYPSSNPSADPAPLRIAKPGAHELPGSQVLDDAPGEEVILTVFSTHPFLRAEMHQRLGRLARDDDTRRLQHTARELGVTVQRVRLAKQR